MYHRHPFDLTTRQLKFFLIEFTFNFYSSVEISMVIRKPRGNFHWISFPEPIKPDIERLKYRKLANSSNRKTFNRMTTLTCNFAFINFWGWRRKVWIAFAYSTTSWIVVLIMCYPSFWNYCYLKIRIEVFCVIKMHIRKISSCPSIWVHVCLSVCVSAINSSGQVCR